jgi:dephospho-CoA kinase
VLRVGLTGGLASGKSTVALQFRERGLHVLFADVLAHELMQPERPVYHEVVQAFGAEVLSAGEGSPIDRAKLAKKAFAAGASRITELNSIVHPAVIRAQEEWMAEVAVRDPHGIAVVEAALLYEAHAEEQFDKMVVVVAPKDLRIARYIERVVSGAEGSERERRLRDAHTDAERRIAAQIPDEVKRAKADFVIENAGSLAELKAQTEQVITALRSLA